ncbi:LuxR C-terminal-related transcriptional regulator [Kribbella sp. NBC_01245]|uniref:ATP-binding protein n=1 Tax=Kribbella sp. NBC_01245 TaxID=2903578 RepID=UPI002E289F12|nr:LuxR C-terminal-related transcriptional regulator [Kribbella sp. NBC_01245]
MPLTALIGRESELQSVSGMLRRARLVTLTGPGGVGKTRTAIEFGRRQARKQADGVWLVDLASVAAEDVAAATTRVLDIRGAAGDSSTEVVRRYLADRDALLLLDNCEHLLDACAEFSTTLLGACAKLRILATSREPLGITGEAVWRLEPLRPDHAYRLFLERARERSPELVPDDDTEAAILEICARVDHLPLGLELAAARVSIMSPSEILASLEAHLGELGRPRRSASARHRSVRAAVEWSYNLLDPVEQAAFRSLAVFVGGFDADAARAVASLSLEMLAGLVDKSLITVVTAPQRRTRYRLLETMREYAAAQLVSADEEAGARARHLRHFATIGIPAEEGWWSPGVAALLAERADDYGNVRAAIEWALATESCVAMRMLVTTRDLFFILGQADGRRLTEEALRRCPERNSDRAECTLAAGQYAYLLVDMPAAFALTTEAVELSAELGERAAEGRAHWFLGLQKLFGAGPDNGREHFVTARAIQQETGDLRAEGRTTATLGLVLAKEGEPAAARKLLEEALSIGVAAQDRASQGQANLYLGILAGSSADPDGASSYFREAVECFQYYQDSTLLPAALVGQASVVVRRDPRTALLVLAAAWEVRARNGGDFPPYIRAMAEQTRAAAAEGTADDTARLWKEGSRLAVDEAIALAFGTTRPRISHDLGVSRRELDAIRLVADGLSNKEIAARLHLSVRTVETHVRHALTKTGLVNRTQLATWARERGE